jgi:EAL and modified HD-GYP domain-containing signal transduction protein
MLEIPMQDILDRISLDQATKAVLLGEPGPLQPVFQLILAHESGQWEQVGKISRSLGLDPETVADQYWESQQWARELSAIQ